MKLLVVLMFGLSSYLAQADEWVDYNYIGKCVGSEENGDLHTMEFYSEGMSENKEVSGVITWNIANDSKSVTVGAWIATYKLVDNESAMEVLSDKILPLKVPFGKNVVVKVEDGIEAVCTTELP